MSCRKPLAEFDATKPKKTRRFESLPLPPPFSINKPCKSVDTLGRSQASVTFNQQSLPHKPAPSPPPPPLINKLYNSNNTLRRLRAPVTLNQKSSTHKPAPPTRTSRWQETKSATINKNASPMTKSVGAKKYAELLSSLSLEQQKQQLQQPGHQVSATNSQSRSTGQSNKMVVLCNSQQNWISPVPSPLFTLPETQRLERSQQSPQLQLRCSSSSGQQIDELPPVYKLNDDCLQEIFHWCATTNNLCQLSSVSRQWRKTALQPYVWRTIDYTWDNFVQQQQQQQQQQNPSLKNVIWDVPSCTKRRKKNNVFSTAKRVMVYNDNTNISESTSFLLHTHIRTIRISNEDKQLSTVKYLGIPPDISPFIAVRKLQLSHMNFNDIVNLVDWFPNLEELDCDKILAPQLTVSITAFEALRKLRVLILNFKSACELADGMPFNLTFITTHQQHDTSLIHQQIEQQRWKLPPQLQTLKIANIHDFDECLTPGISVVESSQMEEGMVELIQAWNRMEEILFRKYMVFTTLHNLTDLSLDNCTAFTAKVWRECIAPCTKQLVRLSLGGWAGDGSRESPLVWETQDASTQSGDMHQVELALSELFAGLSLLESLSLSQFKCAPGLVHGLEQLAQTKNEAPVISHLDATNDKLGAWNKSSPPTDIKDLLGWTLNMAEIKFGQGLPGQIQ